MREARRATIVCILVTAVFALVLPRQLAGQEAKEDAVRSAATRRAVSLYRLAGRTTGRPLPTRERPVDAREATNPPSANGRVTPLDRRSFHALRKVKKGDPVLLPLTDRHTVKGTINIVLEDAGYVRIGGALANRMGSFFLNTNGTDASGLIQLVRDGVAFQV